MSLLSRDSQRNADKFFSGDRSEMSFSSKATCSSFVSPANGVRSVILLKRRSNCVKFTSPEIGVKSMGPSLPVTLKLVSVLSFDNGPRSVTEVLPRLSDSKELSSCNGVKSATGFKSILRSVRAGSRAMGVRFRM